MLNVLLWIVGIVAVLAAAYFFIVKPWYWNWGATPAEISMPLPGDELVPNPDVAYTRAITIHAAPAQIYPWIIQIGQTKGGYYSWTGMENLMGCNMVNADRIHPEWQNLAIGDKVYMMPPDKANPAPYLVEQLLPDQAVVMVHKNADGSFFDTWQYVLVPVDAENTRLILRTRTTSMGFFEFIRPGVFIMERSMLMGIRDRVEGRIVPAAQ